TPRPGKRSWTAARSSASSALTWKRWSGKARQEPAASSFARSLPGRVQTIALLEQEERPLHVPRLLHEPLRVPLAAWHAEEVAAVDVNRSGQTADRIRDGVDDVAAER